MRSRREIIAGIERDWADRVGKENFDELIAGLQSLLDSLDPMVRRSYKVPTRVSGRQACGAAICDETVMSSCLISPWRVMKPDGSYVGIETGSEIFPLLDLDEFVVFPARSKAEQTEKSTNFFRTLIYRHLNSALLVKDKELINSPDQLVSLLFTQVTALQELVRAAEGVPRDALQIVARAGLRAGQGKISTEHVRAAAGQVFQATKAALLNAVPEAQKLLQIITDEVISKKARAFLLRQEHTRDPLIQRLIDDRILHVIKRGYSSKDDPGERFDVLQIDFGCYVSFLQTGSAPETLLGGVDDDIALEALFSDAPAVPEDDYRAIRSSVLDLPRVLESVRGADQ